MPAEHPSIDRLSRVGLLAVAVLLLAVPALGQEPRNTTEVPLGMRTSVAGLTGYDTGGRRDPFVPLFGETVSGATGPRFELLKLTGIFRGSPDNSLVVLEDPSRRGYFVRLGHEIQSARLVEILPQAAVFEVRDYGATRRVVLRLQRAGQSP